MDKATAAEIVSAYEDSIARPAQDRFTEIGDFEKKNSLGTEGWTKKNRLPMRFSVRTICVLEMLWMPS